MQVKGVERVLEILYHHPHDSTIVIASCAALANVAAGEQFEHDEEMTLDEKVERVSSEKSSPLAPRRTGTMRRFATTPLVAAAHLWRDDRPLAAATVTVAALLPLKAALLPLKAAPAPSPSRCRADQWRRTATRAAPAGRALTVRG